MTIEEDLAEKLMTLELLLMDSEFRRDRERVWALLAEEFREFGSSGRAWSRAQTMELLANEPPRPAPVVSDFAVQAIAPGAVLVTYRTQRAGAIALRSSVWVLRDGDWKVVFHQGTRGPK
jgi:hypothetical protein